MSVILKLRIFFVFQSGAVGPSLSPGEICAIDFRSFVPFTQFFVYHLVGTLNQLGSFDIFFIL